MPRPGPRPYECVRRAWHSDRHQPMRGSLIQEIFRIVGEIHSSATKKNKEWQEKLPVVVLKAEEIMYSKANSEVEYMDVNTLWDRTNDAINTIIRREESTETGDLLQPCIEAALILGCTARRNSRSQRNTNPRCYLTPSPNEPTPVPPRAPDNVTHGGSSSLAGNPTPAPAPRFMPHYPTTGRPTSMNTTQLRSESCTPIIHNTNPTMSHGLPFGMDNFSNQIFATESHRSTNVGRSYPLYFGMGAPRQTADSQLIFRAPQGTISTTAVPVTPHVQAVVEPTEKEFLQKHFTGEGSTNALNRNRTGLMGKLECPPEVDFDLSLRLGPFSATCASPEARCIREVEDLETSSSHVGAKSSDPLPRATKEFCFFPKDNADDPHESNKRSSRDEGPSWEGPSRKRKSPASNLVEGEQFSRLRNFPYDMYFGRMNHPDN